VNENQAASVDSHSQPFVADRMRAKKKGIPLRKETRRAQAWAKQLRNRRQRLF